MLQLWLMDKNNKTPKTVISAALCVVNIKLLNLKTFVWLRYPRNYSHRKDLISPEINQQVVWKPSLIQLDV